MTATLPTLALEAESHCALVDGERISLTHLEWELLSLFFAHPWRVYSRKALYDVVWQMELFSPVTLRTIDVHVSRLRRKLGPALSLRTVVGDGYRYED